MDELMMAWADYKAARRARWENRVAAAVLFVCYALAGLCLTVGAVTYGEWTWR